MSFFKRIGLILVVFMVSVPISAYDFKVDDIYYQIISIQDRTCRVVDNGGANKGLNSYYGHVVIPEKVTYNNRTFDVIELGFMGNNPSLLSLKIGNAITKIGTGACKNAINIVDLSIGNSVSSIGEEAFYGCTKLKNIIVPPNVTQFYRDSFRKCPNVESLVMDDGANDLNFWFGNGYSRPFYDCEFRYVYFGRVTCQNSFVDVGSYESNIVDLLYDKNLEIITIGANITKFKYELEYASNLRKIICLSEIPPYISSSVNMFSAIQYQNILLYVPKGSKELYEVAPVWENFWNIIESDKGVTIDELTIDEKDINLNVGETYKVGYKIFPINADNTLLNWTTNNKDVVYVDSYGNITALNPGSAIIYAKTTDGSNIVSMCNINVAQKIEKISLDNYSLSIFENEYKQIEASVYPPAETHIEWKSSNIDVCTVDDNGLVTAVSQGETSITATCSNEPAIFAVCDVRVKRHVQGIVLAEKEITLSKNMSKQLVATIYPESADEKGVRWVSENPLIASVNDNGLVLANEVGKTIIHVYATDGSDVYADCIVNVSDDSYIEALNDDHVAIKCKNGLIEIIGGDDKLDVRVLDIVGKTVYCGCDREISIQDPGIYFILIEHKILKVTI